MLVLTKRWLCGCLFLFFISCSQNATQEECGKNFTVRQRNLYAMRCIEEAKKIIGTGDVITRSGTDFTSLSLKAFSQTDPTYSHCGIASIEHDTVFVYHAIGGELNPNEALQKERLEDFCSPLSNEAFGIFRFSMNNTIKTRMNVLLQQYYASHILFDMKFDLSTDDKMYCAEFVEKVVSRAFANPKMFATSRIGHFTYVAVDNIFLNKKCTAIKKYSYGNQ